MSKTKGVMYKTRTCLKDMGEMKFKFFSEKRVFTFSHASLTVRVLLLSLGYYFMDFFKAEGEIKLNLWNRNEWWLTNEQMDRWTDRDKNWKLLESLSSLQKKHERFLLNFNPLRIWFDSHFTITSTIFFSVKHDSYEKIKYINDKNIIIHQHDTVVLPALIP